MHIFARVLYTRDVETSLKVSQFLSVCPSESLVLVAFHAKTGDPNLIKPCTMLTDISISNITL